jgi:hypothetical protein
VARAAFIGAQAALALFYGRDRHAAKSDAC